MFRSGLEFIKAASEAMLWVDSSGSKRAARNCTWPWDDVLNGGTAPFGLIGSWMDVSGAERKGGHDLRFAPFPTWKKTRLSPFAQTKSFAISAGTPFPSAAHELMRLLNSKEGFRAMADSTRNVPVLGPKAKIKLDFLDPNRREIAAAFAYHFPEPALLLPGNPGKPAMDLYYSIGVNLMYRAVWDGSKTPEEAQGELFKRSLQWLADNDALAVKPPPAADKAAAPPLGDAAAFR
jgi:arabinogalactan oligomer/maltooligosaccharide transport system substrate-binding protein